MNNPSIRVRGPLFGPVSARLRQKDPLAALVGAIISPTCMPSLRQEAMRGWR